MHEFLVDLLQCPACHGEIAWSFQSKLGDHIEEGSARCSNCSISYPIREGIGLFIIPDLDRDDLWEGVESGLMRAVRENPDLERLLMDSPLESLEPADQFFRAMILDERGEFVSAEEVERIANEGLYTPEHMMCWESQVDYLLNRLKDVSNPVLDLASGRCYLVEKLANTVSVPIIATDFSPRVLKRDRRWLEAKGLYDQISLLAFDARQTPFKDGALQTISTNLGLPNIKEPGKLFQELRRIVSGSFFAITNFYAEGDGNAAVIEQYGLGDTLYRTNVIAGMTKAGFHVELANNSYGKSLPTPLGVILEGAQIDGLPIVEAELEWCVIEST